MKGAIHNHVCLGIQGATVFESVVVFAFDRSTPDAAVLIEEFSTLHPFIYLDNSIVEEGVSHIAFQTALNAMKLVVRSLFQAYPRRTTPRSKPISHHMTRNVCSEGSPLYVKCLALFLRSRCIRPLLA